MKRLIQYSWSLVFSLLIVMVIVAQERTRTVEQSAPLPNQPIEVVTRELGNKPFMSETQVAGGPEWLGQLLFGVKNVSNRSIMAFDLAIWIKKQGTMPVGVSFPLRFRTYSKNTGSNSRTPEGAVKLGMLRPGEVVNVKINARDLKVFGDALKGYGMEDIDRVTLEIRIVYFEDQSRWSFGQESRPDPNNPGRRLPVNQDAAPPGRSFLEVPRYDPYAFLGGGWVQPAVYSSALKIPARKSRDFFYGAKSPAPPPTCVWFKESELRHTQCLGFCDPEDFDCVFDDFSDAIYATDPGGGSLGYVSYDLDGCHVPYIPDPPTCSTCVPFNNSVFHSNPQCGQAGGCNQPSTWGCQTGFEDHAGTCVRGTLFINGFALSDAINGVEFDLNANGIPELLGWTLANTDDAWLALDRDNDGLITSGRELFGDATFQPPPPAGTERNGFRALAVYDRPGNGGNGDGKIDNHDSIFSQLRLWQDTNHNGISESGELHTLPELGLRTIDLDYTESRRTDEFGNQFRYRAKVKDKHDAQLGRWAWDVFLVTSQ